MKRLILLGTHLATLALGFALGVYALPILIAPPAPTETEIATQAGSAQHRATFRRDLEDSDALHWGEGTVSVGRRSIALVGELAPGPDYKLYLSPEFVETEADFERLKPSMARVGDVKTFKNFLVPVPESIDVERYNTVVIWCESFSQAGRRCRRGVLGLHRIPDLQGDEGDHAGRAHPSTVKCLPTPPHSDAVHVDSWTRTLG
jgi:hypothetical protein